jgi:ArsR family transcriptional regulator
VIAEAARVLAGAGRIAIVDFAAHDREELRSAHAHARLGFSDKQMSELLVEAGFTPAKPVALAGDPLTVKIWTGTCPGKARIATQFAPALEQQ